MPSKDPKRELYIASSMAELQKKSEVKPSTSNARILVKSADTMFREAEKFNLQGDEERAFIMYMRYFNIVKQVKINADYKKNKQYYDNLIGQKNQVRAIEQAEQLADSLKERYDFKEAEAVAKKFASLEAAGKRTEKDDEKEEVKDGGKVNGVSAKDSQDSKDQPSTSSHDAEVQALVTPTALYNILKDPSSKVIVMDARSSADFAESHINHAACISIPQEVIPPGTTVTRMETQLPEGSLLLWRQRGSVDHIVLLDWNSKLESVTIGTTLRTLKDALFKYDSTVIVKKEPLVLEGGYDQWLLFYPTVTTNARVARPFVATAAPSVTSLDFDYPEFEEPQAVEPPPASANDLSQFMDKGASVDSVTSVPAAIPQFNRALKPKTSSSSSLAESLSKPSNLNNARNVNLASDSQPGEGLSLVSNNLYPSMQLAKKPEKNTNMAVDRNRAPEVDKISQGDGGPPPPPSSTASPPSSLPPSSTSSLQEVEEQQARLHELEEKRKEERALADIMRKKRHAEQDLKDTERLKEQESLARQARDSALQEEELERRRQAEVERLRQERKRKELEAGREKERLDNLAREKELQEAADRAQREEEDKIAAQKSAQERAEALRQEQAKEEADRLARLQQKQAEEDRRARQEDEEDRKRKEEEERLKLETEQRRERERGERERAERERTEKEQAEREQAEKERAEKERAEKERLEAARREEASRMARKTEEEKRAQLDREREKGEPVAIRRAQEPKMIPSPSLPTGWEKRLDSATRRYYYIDHNHGTTQWEPPASARQAKQPAAADTYVTRLKEEPAVSTRGLSRSHSSPDIMKQLADEAKKANSIPAFDRTSKPAVRPVDPTPARAPAVRYTARRRDLNPVFGNVGPALTGLRNLGNTCYMNSTIQCLINTTPLVSYFLNDNFLSDINRDSEQGMHGEVVEEFAVVVKALWSGQYRCITPRDLKYTVGKYNPMFAGYQQQDSQEFLTFLLDGLHEGLNEVKVRPQIPEQENDRLPDHKAAHLAWENHKRLHRSIIVELFQGQLKSTLMCRTCHKKSVTFQAFMYISLPIPASSKCSLRDCFRAFLQPEMMTGSCKWKCTQCRVERDAEKKIDIWKLPHILLIGLNRFVSDGMWMQKKTTYVDFPVDDLDLEDFTLGSQQRSRYNLYGVSNHYGTMEGGHYTAFCRNPCNSKWHKFDDHEVYEMSKSDVKTSAAFVLYYTSIPLNAPLFKPQL